MESFPPRSDSSSRPAQDSPWIVRPRSASGAKLRLFCFPYAGGGPSAFRRWVTRLPEEVECCLVQLPGKESRVLEPPLSRMDEIVERIHEAIRPMLDLPFAFFGHSMGGKVSFELARKLRGEGQRGPVKLFISATRAPGVPDPDPELHHLPDAEFIAEIQKRYDAIPEDVVQNEELLELILPGLRADFEAMETQVLRDEPPLDCPIGCFGGELDDRVGEEDLAPWSNQTTSAFDLTMFPGDHFFIQSSEERFLPFLGGELRKLLDSLR